MCGNGAPTGTAVTITAKGPMKIRLVLRAVTIACCAAVRGTTMPATRVVRIATTAIRIIVSTLSGFVVFVSFSSSIFFEFCNLRAWVLVIGFLEFGFPPKAGEKSLKILDSV